jgi:hypothetical protein
LGKHPVSVKRLPKLESRLVIPKAFEIVEGGLYDPSVQRKGAWAFF